MTHDLGWCGWKAMVDFLFALIELFSLSITVPELWGETYTARLFSQGVDLFALKFYLDSVLPIYHSWHQKTRDMGYPVAKTASLCVPSFWHNTGVWRTDRLTDGRTDVFVVAYTPLAKLALRCAIKSCCLYCIDNSERETGVYCIIISDAAWRF